MVEGVGAPLASRAGSNRPLRVASRHVAASRSPFPLDAVTRQATTLPSVPTSTDTLTRPSAPARRAAGG